jgi:predicted ATPase
MLRGFSAWLTMSCDAWPQAHPFNPPAALNKPQNDQARLMAWAAQVQGEAQAPGRPLSPSGPGAATAADKAQWQVRLLGAVEARQGQTCINRFPSRAVAALLARLALAPGRAHAREEMVELLWPGVALDVGRNRLRQALSTLKSLLEPAHVQARGPAQASLIAADRFTIRLLPGAVDCDAVQFERLVRAAQFGLARDLYQGELMPGFYEDWVVQEREHFAQLLEKAELALQPAAAGAATAAPAASTPAERTATVTALASNLPSFWTRSVGAEHSAARLRSLVWSQRLVTVHGPGGSGKTRLAVEVARGLRDQPPVGLVAPALDNTAAPATTADAAPGTPSRAAFTRVVFVPLVDCVDAAQTLDAISSALQAGNSGEPHARITAVLASGYSLLVLDNAEQLSSSATQAITRLLSSADGLHALVTSRRLLDLDGEHAFELDGLPLPASDAALVDTATNPAVMLFIDRARAARTDFHLTARNVQPISDLVRLLGGMPLAIELAASRVRAMPPAELLQRLSDGAGSPMLDLLARNTQRTSVGSRHESMRHVVDWSWRQLNPTLIGTLQALAAFAYPATLDAVAAVAGLDVRTAQEQVEQLRDQSLVMSRPNFTGAAGVQRYVLLQPVREFVLERCEASARAAVQQRLRQWLISFGQRCAALAHKSIDDVEAELPLVYGAISDAVAAGAYEDAARIAVGLRRYWELDTRAGLPASAIQVLETAQVHLADPGLRSRLCVLLCFSRVMSGFPPEALALAETAVALAPEPSALAHALMRRVQVQVLLGRNEPPTDPALEQALKLARQAGNKEVEALTLRIQMLVATNRDNDHLRAEKLAHQAQLLWEQLGHRRNAYSGLLDRAACWIEQGRLDEAAAALTTCEDVARQERYATGAIMAAWQLGRVLAKLRQVDAALAAFRRCVRDSWANHRLTYVADALLLVPSGLVLTGKLSDRENAAKLYGFAVPHWQRQFGNFYSQLEHDVRVQRRLLLHALGPVRFDALRMQGAVMELTDAVVLALGDMA